MVSVIDSLGGNTDYLYDELNQMIGISQIGENERRIDINYNPVGLKQDVSLYYDVAGTQFVGATDFSYDCNDCPLRITTITHSRADSSVINSLSFVRDDVANILQSGDNDGTHSYMYDSLSQLVSAQHTGSTAQVDESYTYDPVGNRTSSHLSSSYTYSYIPGAGGENQLQQDDTFDYSYDLNGQLRSRTDRFTGETVVLTYDHRRRTTSIEIFNIGNNEIYAVDYLHGPLNNRIKVTTNGVASWYLYENSNPIAVVDDASGNIVSRQMYTRNVDDLIAVEESNESLWYLRDSIGTVRDIILDDGTVQNHLVYDSFGQLLATSSGERPLIDYTGREFDKETGFGDYRFRTYLPDLGRFSTTDLLFPFQYEYVRNNPITRTDPFGLADAEQNGILTTLQSIAAQTQRVVGHKVSCAIAVVGIGLALGTGNIDGGSLAAARQLEREGAAHCIRAP